MCPVQDISDRIAMMIAHGDNDAITFEMDLGPTETEDGGTENLDCDPKNVLGDENHPKPEDIRHS